MKAIVDERRDAHGVEPTCKVPPIAPSTYDAHAARQGGMPSALWAGPGTVSAVMERGDVPIQGTARRKPVSLKLGFGGDDYGYAVHLGLPVQERPPVSLFFRDPEIKAEAACTGPHLERSTAYARREGSRARVLSGGGGDRRPVPSPLGPADSLMTHCAGRRGAPESLEPRERMPAWRFYDHLRTDRDAPARRPQVGARTMALAGDASALDAAVTTPSRARASRSRTATGCSTSTSRACCARSG